MNLSQVKPEVGESITVTRVLRRSRVRAHKLNVGGTGYKVIHNVNGGLELYRDNTDGDIAPGILVLEIDVDSLRGMTDGEICIALRAAIAAYENGKQHYLRMAL